MVLYIGKTKITFSTESQMRLILDFKQIILRSLGSKYIKETGEL